MKLTETKSLLSLAQVINTASATGESLFPDYIIDIEDCEFTVYDYDWVYYEFPYPHHEWEIVGQHQEDGHETFCIYVGMNMGERCGTTPCE